MTRHAAIRGAALALAASMLSGCVAAVIPLAAGATIVRSATTGDKDRETASVPADAGASAHGAESAPVRLAALPVAAEELAEDTVAPAGPRTDGKIESPGPSGNASGAKPRLVSTTGMAPPSGFASAMPIGSANSTIDEFFAYTARQTLANEGGSPRRSALLAAPGLLRPERAPCNARPAAAIIDIDPGRETFDPLAEARADPRLARALAGLRAQDVSIYWISRLGEGFAERLRVVLAQTGLDPMGQDALLLHSGLDQRKQTLRNQIGRTHCVVSVMGDERADFDELYHYLKDPATAIALDAMVGAGWFLFDPVIAGPPDETNGD